jgi:glycosyltransferase involved in cell wall biosynthesis
MASVIIPAHNEANVIAKTLQALIPALQNGMIELVVVCNGCSDATVKIVRSFSAKIKCLETSVASKTHALNLGDEVASEFPRIYLDADIILSTDSVMALVERLSQGYYLAASSTMRMDYHGSSWFVKSFYCIWQQLPYVKEGMIGTGVYALSEEGRKRFGKFPDIIADDGFIRAMFKREERSAVPQSYSNVRAPAKLSDLIKIKTRSRLGRYELAQKFPELMNREEKKYGSAFFPLLKKPANLVRLPIYLYVNMVSRLRAKSQYKLCGFTGWERDTSSRRIHRDN